MRTAQPDYTSYNRPSVKDARPDDFLPMPAKLPAIKEVGMPAFIEILKKEFGLDKNNYAVINSAGGDNVIITFNRLRHILEKQDGREAFVPLIRKTLENPWEVWLSEYVSDKGFIEYRKDYFGLFRDEKDRQYYVGIRVERDSTILWNAFPKDERALDKSRKGYLILAKK
ncbi:MAG: hypothetical protein L6Q59_16325 [Ignavibacteriaceae bacterium]|nr:hypothetical protein [Ignavibacteriaceae bacterium]